MTERIDVRRILNALTCDKAHCRCQRSARDGQGLVHCPCHSDERPSLNVTVGNDGTILLRCHAGCPNHAVIRALQDRDLWPRRERRERPPARETRYELRDMDGTLVAIHIRRDKPDGSKELFWQLPDGRWGLNGKRVEELPLYGVEKLGDAPAVIIVEGEKAAGALLQLGLSAVGTVCGASTTPSEDVLQPLVGRRVYLWPDNDAPGQEHMQRIAARLASLGCNDIRVVEWPDAPAKGDAADFVARGGTADDVRRLLERARPWTPNEASVSANAEPDAAPQRDGDERSERRSQADRLIGYALASGARFLIDQFGQPHVLVDGVPLALPRGAYPWLRRLLWEHEQRGATGEALQTAAGVLEALALHEGERVELFVRSAWHEPSRTLYVWLGPRRVLAIDVHGWHVRAEAPVLFRQYPTLLELPDPADGMTVEALADCLDLVAPADEAGRRLVTAWLATAWLPHVARPILLYMGDWGAGKTLRQRLIKRLLDPTKPESVRLDPREIVQKLAHCQIALFDNLGSLSEWAIDSLCRAVTGEGDSKRRLYTDDEDVVFEFRRALLLNGINPPADRPDFTDRLLPVELERIPDTRRQEEATIWARFAERHGVWLGALATLLSRAIAAEPAVELRRKPRLADWGRWAAAVYDALGWGAAQFEQDWATVVEKQQAAAVEGSPVAQAVLRFMADRHNWRGTASELLAALDPVALELGLVKAKGWPKSPVWLARRLRELRPVLADRGITAREERDGHERTRQWILARQTHPENGPEIPSARVLPSAQARNPRPDVDLAADGNADSKPGWDAIPSALLSAQDPHVDGQADGADAADGIFGAFSDDQQPVPVADVAFVEQLRERLRWLAPVHASRLAEAVGVPFAQLQPVLQRLVEGGQLAVVHGEARVLQHSVLVLPEQTGRLVRQTPRTLWRQREELQ